MILAGAIRNSTRLRAANTLVCRINIGTVCCGSLIVVETLMYKKKYYFQIDILRIIIKINIFNCYLLHYCAPNFDVLLMLPLFVDDHKLSSTHIIELLSKIKFENSNNQHLCMISPE